MIRTERLIMRRWRPDDLAPFADLNADPQVMQHFPEPLARADSDALARRIEDGFDRRGFGFWALEIAATGRFIGFTGLSVPAFPAPFQPSVEIGWRLARHAWGHGYAAEAARRALRFAFTDAGLPEVVSFTAVPNTRSQAVMRRIGMRPDPAGGFDHPRLPPGHPLRRHVLWRLDAATWQTTPTPTPTPGPGPGPGPRAATGRDPEYLAFLTSLMAAAPPPGPRSLAQARRDHAADLAALPRPPAGTVTDLTVPGADRPLPARLYRPAPGTPALVYFHGGGWALGDVDSYDPVVRALVRATGLAIVSIGYRRPPEHPFPAAVDDAVAATRWVTAHAPHLGLDPARLGVAGDSAGGQIAAATASRLRRTGLVALQLLLYPALDLRDVPPDPPDPDGLTFPPSDARRALHLYAGDADRTDPDLSPLLDPDPRGLPPAIIATAEHDRLRPQAEQHAARLTAAGVPVTLITGTGLDHGFLGWGSYARRPAEAIAEIGAAARAALPPRPTGHREPAGDH